MGPRPQAGGGEIKTDTVEKKTPDADFSGSVQGFFAKCGR